MKRALGGKTKCQNIDRFFSNRKKDFISFFGVDQLSANETNSLTDRYVYYIFFSSVEFYNGFCPNFFLNASLFFC